MIFEGISQLIGGISANKQHKKYAELLAQQNMTMPSGITDAEGIFKKNASQGLPGYEQYAQDINSLLPSTVNTAKEVVDNPSQLLDAVMRAQETAGSKMRDLGIADAGAKLQNEAAYAGFLSNTKAPMETALEEFKMNRDLGVMKEKMAGKQELWKGIGGFANTLDSATLAAASLGSGNILGGFSQMAGGGGGGQTVNAGQSNPFTFNPYTNGQNPAWTNQQMSGYGTDIFSQMLFNNSISQNPFGK